MPSSTSCAAAVLVLGLAWPALSARPRDRPPRAVTVSDAVAGPAAFPGRGLPIQRAHRYRMSGRIRPLLFWITRDNVGSGSIVWRGTDERASAWELLIGSDPARAPRGLNRWGYIAEEAGPVETRVLGVMSSSEEGSLQDVVHTLDGAAARGRFKAIEARVQPGSSTASVGIIETERDLTIHDVAALLDRVGSTFGAVPSHQAAVPAGVRPGFLTAVAECLRDTAVAWRTRPATIDKMAGQTVRYVYGRAVFDLAIRSVTPVQAFPVDGEVVTGLLRTAFEIRDHRDGGRYRFELTYGTTGALAEVPVVIKYQPKWWLQVELVYDSRQAVGAPTTPPTAVPGLAR